MTNWLQTAAVSASSAVASAPASPSGGQPGPVGLERGVLSAPSWLVLLLALVALAAVVGFFVVRRWRTKKLQVDASVAPLSSRR